MAIRWLALRLCVPAAAYLLLAACAVAKVEITSTTARRVIVVPDEVVRRQPLKRRDRFIASRPRRGLPRRINAWSDQSYWVVPICGGNVRIDLGGPYQLTPERPFPIECR